MYVCAQDVLARARAGEGPVLVEAKTYRKGGHSRADPAKYRPQAEVDEWMKRDPVDVYRARLLELGFDEGQLLEIEQDAQRQVDEATDFAKSAAEPDGSTLMTEVWADGGSSWRN
jgi:acetoin:2,6-dichlorophenolindophenol oxidoreductase subunit alpha